MTGEQDIYKNLHTLCDEAEIVSDKSKPNNVEINNIKERFRCWILGFIISCIPMLGLAVYKVLTNENIKDIFIQTLSESEIMFLGVSIAVTAMYDYVSYQKKFSWTYIIIMLLGTILYMAIALAESIPSVEFNSWYACGLNISFVSIVLLRGFVQYAIQYYHIKKEC